MIRKKKRYILVYFEIKNIEEKELIRAIKARIVDLFGALGLKSISPKLIEMRPFFFIIRCSHDRADDLLFTISSMRDAPFFLYPSL